MNKTIIELREEAIKEDKNPEFYLYQKLEEKDKQLDKYKNVIDKIKEYVKENKKILYQGRNEFTCEIQYSDEVVEVKNIEELLEEVE